MAIVRELKLAKSTKGTYVYKDDSQDAPVSTLYIRREDIEVDGKAPPAIRLSVETI